MVETDSPLADQLEQHLDENCDYDDARGRVFFALGVLGEMTDDEVSEALSVLSDEIKEL